MKVRSDEVKRALSIRHHEDFFLTEVKSGATHTNNELLKMDAMAIKKSWANPCITGYEVKVDRSDFLRDNKWPGYMTYCNQLSFVCPSGLISPDELPVEVGLIYYNPEKKSLTTKRKALYRNITIPEPLLYYIIMNRLDNERHPFFSSRREYVEAYMADRDERKDLGRRFGLKVSEELATLREEAKGVKRKEERDKQDLDEYEKMRAVLQDYGIKAFRWGGWEKELRAMLNGGGVSPKVAEEAQRLFQQAERLSRLLNPEPIAVTS